jgi:hypothetical protein
MSAVFSHSNGIVIAARSHNFSEEFDNPISSQSQAALHEKNAGRVMNCYLDNQAYEPWQRKLPHALMASVTSPGPGGIDGGDDVEDTSVRRMSNVPHAVSD